MQTKPRIFCISVRRAWVAWVEDRPELKYRGRTHYEALGKLLLANEVPDRYTMLMVGPIGRRIIPCPAPDFTPSEWDHWATPDETDPSLGPLAGYVEELRRRSHLAP